MAEQEFKQHIALHLKTLRKDRGLSLDALAKMSGVSKAMLGQIERQESSPTISTLWKIASGLDASFSAFFASGPDDREHSDNFPRDPDMKVKAIFPYSADTRIEVMEVCLLNFHEQQSDPHAPGVIEHVYVTEGALSLHVDGAWHDLKCGGSLRFHADQPHVYKSTAQTTRFQNIICYQAGKSSGKD